jgi:hypothetical protein
MRYQHKWQDVDPKEIPPANQANLEACIHRSLELGINHIETARGYGTSEMQLGWVLPKLPRERMIIQTKVSPRATAREFIETFNTSMKYLQLDHVELLTLHGINNRQLLDWSLKKGGSLDAARQLQREGRCKFVGFTTHATTDVIHETIRGGEFDYVNLHWYFVNDLNWSCIEAATAKDMGVFIISPNDKGWKLYEPPAKLMNLCAPLSPMVFNDLYCLARPQVHTLSCGVAKPSDFDEHIKPRWSIMIRRRRSLPRSKSAFAPRWSGSSAQTGVSCGRKACPVIPTCRARSMSQRFSGSGPMPNPWTSWLGARCDTTCWDRRTTGFPERTPPALQNRSWQRFSLPAPLRKRFRRF